ncbi:hypothetical protein HPULCUR_000425 [Helicostylum pulchrum]|uniref:Uncharacterized protein n=1 Tax=Helicostylum pulchrum TaxID=562976 RepID=A0ABP9XJU5_9FUNG
MSNQHTEIQLETTPRVYYEHYMTATPSYDLYPSLSRRLGNGYIHRPTRPVQKQQQTNFISMNIVARRTHNTTDDPLWQPQPQPQLQQQETPSWDLYPSVLRNVENFGTDQMRQRLHAMEATITSR